MDKAPSVELTINPVPWDFIELHESAHAGFQRVLRIRDILSWDQTPNNTQVIYRNRAFGQPNPLLYLSVIETSAQIIEKIREVYPSLPESKPLKEVVRD